MPCRAACCSVLLAVIKPRENALRPGEAADCRLWTRPQSSAGSRNRRFLGGGPEGAKPPVLMRPQVHMKAILERTAPWGELRGGLELGLEERPRRVQVQ